MRGAWIEIISACRLPTPRCGRSPCGERGLKSALPDRDVPGNASLPVRGAWIEIILRLGVLRRVESLPVRGAWIEMMILTNMNNKIEVAPRAGSVD